MGKEKKSRSAELLQILDKDDLQTSDITRSIQEFLIILEKSARLSMDTFIQFLEIVDKYEPRSKFSVNEILLDRKYGHHAFYLLQEQSTILTLDLANYRSSFLKFAISSRTEQIVSFLNQNSELHLDRFSPKSGITFREFLFAQSKSELKKIVDTKISFNDTDIFWVNLVDIRCLIGCIRICMIKGVDPEQIFMKIDEKTEFKATNYFTPGFEEVKHMLMMQKTRPVIEKIIAAATKNARGGAKISSAGRSLKRGRTTDEPL